MHAKSMDKFGKKHLESEYQKIYPLVANARESGAISHHKLAFCKWDSWFVGNKECKCNTVLGSLFKFMFLQHDMEL